MPGAHLATDNLGDPAYRGILLGDFLAASATSGLDWDPDSQTGAVYRMLRSLEQQGRIGVTALGDTPDQAHEIYLRAAELLDQLRVQGTGAA